MKTTFFNGSRISILFLTLFLFRISTFCYSQDCPYPNVPIPPITNIENNTGPITSCLYVPGIEYNSNVFGGPFIYSGDCTIGVNRYLSRIANTQSLSALIYDPEWLQGSDTDCDPPYNNVNNTAYCPDQYCEMINSLVQMNIQFLERGYLGSYLHEPFSYHDNWFETGKQFIRDVNYAYDLAGKRRPIIQATVFEVVDNRNFDNSWAGKIPVWMISKYFLEYPEDLPAYEDYYYNPIDPQHPNDPRTPKVDLRWEKDRILSPTGIWSDYQIDYVEMRMYFLYQAYTLIDMGYTALHMGLYRLYTPNDEGHKKLYKLTQEIREYANCRGSFVVLSCEPQFYPSPKFDNTDLFIFDFDSRAMRPRELNNPPVSGDGLPLSTGCIQAYDPEVVEAMTTSPCSLAPEDLPAIIDTCTISSQGGGSGISPLGCYVEELPYIVHWDGFRASENTGVPSPGFDSQCWGYHDHEWFSLLDLECKKWWFDYFYCYVSDFSGANGWLSVPAVIVSGSGFNGDARQYISDEPGFVSSVITSTSASSPPTFQIEAKTCFKDRLQTSCNGIHSSLTECYHVGDQCYVISVGNTDCSSVYSIHIKDPNGNWLPSEIGDTYHLCPSIPGDYDIFIRQDNLGLTSPENLYGITTTEVLDYPLNSECCNPQTTFACDPCCPPGFITNETSCFYDANLYGVIGYADNINGRFYTTTNCSVYYINNCCPPGTSFDRNTGRCYYPLYFNPLLFQGYVYNGDFYTNTVDCEDPFHGGSIDIRGSEVVELNPKIQVVSVSPNPFDENFEINMNFGDWNTCEVFIYSTIGDIVFQNDFKNEFSGKILVATAFPPGLYILNIKIGDKQFALKIVRM